MFFRRYYFPRRLSPNNLLLVVGRKVFYFESLCISVSLGVGWLTFESDRSMAAVGALLIAIGSFFAPLGIIGIILLLIGMNGLANYYGDRAIYSHALWGFLFGIIGLIAAGVIVLGGFFFGFFIFNPFAGGFAVVGLIIVAAIVMFIFFLLEAVYFRKAFDILRDRSGEGLFGTAGMLLLVGAILTIVLVGLLLLLIGWLIAAVAFFSMRPSAAGVPAPGAGVPAPPAPVASASVEKRYCSNCGAENKPDATYCASCGQKL